MVRVKSRYYVVYVDDIENKHKHTLKIQGNALYNAIMLTVEYVHGDYGVAALRNLFIAKYINDYTRIVVLRSKHGVHKLLGSSLPFVQKIGQLRVKMNILYCGASLRHCFKFIAAYQQKKYEEFCVLLETPEEREELKKLIFAWDSVDYANKAQLNYDTLKRPKK